MPHGITKALLFSEALDEGQGEGDMYAWVTSTVRV